MLDTMRSAAQSWAMKGFLGLLLASFLLWGIPEAFRYQGSSNDLFSSGDSSISANDYLFEQQNTLARFAAATGRFLNPAELRALGVPHRVIMQLQRNVLLDEEARRMKIGTSDEAVLRLLQQDELFQDAATGNFDRNRFIGFTQQMQIPQESIFSQLEMQARRDQIVRALAGGMSMPDAFYQATLLYQRETRSVDYIKLDRVDVETLADPDEEVLVAWFETQGANFRAPEYRTITYMQMTREQQILPENITDDELEAYYQQNRAILTAPEKRTIEQLRFDNREAADKAAAQLQAGTSFEALVAEYGQKLEDIRLDPQSREEMPSLMGGEVFSLAEGEVSGVINDLAGPVIVRLVAIEEAEPFALSEVAEQLKHDLAARHAVSLLREARDQIENVRFNGATLPELATEYGLEAVHLTLDANGTTAEGEEIEDLPQRAALLQAIFQGVVGVDSDPLFDNDGYLWYHIDSITPARDKTLDEVRPQAIKAWKEAQAQQLLEERAADLLAQLQAGKSLTQIAQENALQVSSQGGLQRGSINAALGREANGVIFAVLENEFGMAAGSDNESRLLFQVISSADPVALSRDGLSNQEQKNIDTQMVRDIEGQFLLSAQDAHPVTQNLQLLDMLLNQ